MPFHNPSCCSGSTGGQYPCGCNTSRWRCMSRQYPVIQGTARLSTAWGIQSSSIFPGTAPHTVSIYLDGYQPYTTTVYVPSGQEAVVRAALQPVPATMVTAGLTPGAPATPDLLHGIITMIRNLFSGGWPWYARQPVPKREWRCRHHHADSPSGGYDPCEREGDRCLLLHPRQCL